MSSIYKEIDNAKEDIQSLKRDSFTKEAFMQSVSDLIGDNTDSRNMHDLYEQLCYTLHSKISLEHLVLIKNIYYKDREKYYNLKDEYLK